MVGPARKREAVKHVRERLGTSERRACRSLGVARSTQRYRGRRREADAALVATMRKIAVREPRAGYRRISGYLRREGWQVNVKRVHRLWKQEGLKVPARPRKKRRLGQSVNGSQRRKAERINHVWSYDFVHDRPDRGRHPAQMAADPRRIHPRMLKPGSRVLVHRRGRRDQPRALGRRARRARLHPVRQRPGVRRPCRKDLDRTGRHRHPLY